MLALTKAQQVRFYSVHEKYSGDLIAGTILSMAERFVGFPCLDVGAGSGALVEECARKYDQITAPIWAVDLLPNEWVERGDSTELQFPNNKFQTVFCTSVIEHLSDDDLEKTVAEIRRVLKPGGYGIFTTGFREKLEDFVVACPDCGREFHRAGHCQSFDMDRIRFIFRRFKLVKTKVCNLGFIATLGWPAKLFYRLGLNRFCNSYRINSNFFFVVRKME